MTDSHRQSASFPWLALFIIVAPMLLFCVFALPAMMQDTIQANYAFGSDEGLHAMYAMAIRQDFARFDMRALLDDTWVQGQWPPVLSWLVGLLSLPFSPTATVQRLVVLAMVPLLGLVAAWAAGEAFYRRRGMPLAASFAGLMAVAAPSTLAFGSMVYMEIPGMLIVLACLGAYLHARRTGQQNFWLLAGFLLTASWFLKFQHGAVLSIALLLDLCLRRGSSAPDAFSARRGWMILFGIPALFLIIWLFDLRHWRDLLIYLTRTAKQTGYFPLASYGWWLSVFGSQYHLHWVFSLFSAAGLGLALWRLHRWPLFPVLVYTLICLVILIRLPIRYAHYGYWIAPGFWLLGAGFICTCFDWFKFKDPIAVRLQIVGAILLTIIGLMLVPANVSTALAERKIWCPPAQCWAVYENIATQVTPAMPLVTFGGWSREINPFTMKWWWLAHSQTRLGDMYVENWHPKRGGYKPVKLRWRLNFRDPSRSEFKDKTPAQILEALNIYHIAIINTSEAKISEDEANILDQLLRDDSWKSARSQLFKFPADASVELKIRQ